MESVTQVAVTGDPGAKTAVQALEVGEQPEQPQVVALIQRHQADKGTRRGDRLRYELMI